MTGVNGTIKVRRMTDRDLEKVIQIDRLLFNEKRVRTWPFAFETYWDIYGPGLTYVAEIDGRIVGFLAGNITEEQRDQSILDLMHTIGRSSRYPKIGWIDMIGVLPDFQGRHVGESLVDAFVKECKRHNAPARIIIKQGDQRLTSFLEKLRFRRWETATYEKE